MRCPRCGNTDPRWFYHGSQGWYCRKCVAYGNRAAEPDDQMRLVDPEYHLPFELTPAQKQVSDRLAELSRKGRGVLLQAVCGAGKTELVMAAVSAALARGEHVGFAIARRQVVLEIAQRLTQAFSGLTVVAVCQGHTERTAGDIVVCTTHQLFRYPGYFDLLIIDEPDAFPYKDDEVLHGLAAASCRGRTVYLTATPDGQLLEEVRRRRLVRLYLGRRPHGHPLCVPRACYGPPPWLWVRGLAWLTAMTRRRRPVMVFVPSRRLGWIIYLLVKPFTAACHLDSTTAGKDEVIAGFKAGRWRVCVCTSVLERGVTIPGVSVMVVEADHPVYDQAALVQISGRVGRAASQPDGDCLLLCRQRMEKIDACIADITAANAA